jgi:hypothetical protein
MRSVPPRGSGWVQRSQSLMKSLLETRPTRYREVVLTSCRVSHHLVTEFAQEFFGFFG